MTKGRTWSSTSTTMSHRETIRIYESISRPRAQYAIRRKRAQPSSISAIRAQITLSLMRAPRRCIKRFRTRQVRVAHPRVILRLIMAMHLQPCCRTMSCSSTRCITTTHLPSRNLWKIDDTSKELIIMCPYRQEQRRGREAVPKSTSTITSPRPKLLSLKRRLSIITTILRNR